MAGLIPVILDGGECALGIESTVVNCLTDNPMILRPGSITKSAIEEALGREATYATSQINSVMLSPGMKYRHYAPHAKVSLCNAHEAMGYVGVAATVVLTATPDQFMDMTISGPAKAHHTHALNHPHPLKQQTFYAELRRADDIGANTVVIVMDDATAQNEGLMNCILKASGGVNS
jgi:L-threonylcarbamoyladenylate synthase